MPPLIRSDTELLRIRREWNGVRQIQAKIQRHLAVGFSAHELRNIAHNLALLHAYSVIGDVLQQMRDEGLFVAKNGQLGTLMYASRASVPWCDFVVVDRGREDRNRVAHDQATLERAVCWRYVDAIEEELVAWDIVTDRIPFDH